jgi:uncharacterized protein (TIGR02466 family)
MIKELFPTKVSIVKLNIDIVRLQTAVDAVCKTYENDIPKNPYGLLRGNSRMYSSETYDFLISNPIIQEFNNSLNVEVNSFWKELNYRGIPIQCFTLITEFKQNSYIDVHCHAPADLVATFYLKKPKDSSNIMVVDPNADLLYYQPNNLDYENYADWFHEELQIEEGDLVLFPGYLKHLTKPTITQEDRIIIATNYKASC